MKKYPLTISIPPKKATGKTKNKPILGFDLNIILKIYPTTNPSIPFIKKVKGI